MPKELTDKQKKKQEYNKRYQERLKERLQEIKPEKNKEAHTETETETQTHSHYPDANGKINIVDEDKLNALIEKLEKERMDANDDVFFLNAKKPTTQTAKKIEPVPVVIHQPSSNLKQKLLETLALSAISMIPMIIKSVCFSQSKPQSEQKPANTENSQPIRSSIYCPPLNLL